MNVTTSDGRQFRLSEKMYRQSILLRHLAEETNVPEGGPELLVEGEVFEKIVEFMRSHEEDAELAEEYNVVDVLLSDFDRAFIEVDNLMLFKITAAANYLHMPLLLEICCKVIAEALKEKTTEEIRRYLSIPKKGARDEAAIQKEYKWIE
ncbi:S-phase kinase-associated protein 1 [Nematocida homosporus]|uniref:S-phase kinase-associated protein 1 n=1 Tax=Nematocida homosporus TaxID=1912981 RepID=UPI0022212907|nr:S-phase kinase-associated protein 1 [Nematocida homosporus]KAI5185872.1 S-phase kinase-associated protein 1 [Nematocida homosporus]